MQPAGIRRIHADPSDRRRINNNNLINNNTNNNNNNLINNNNNNNKRMYDVDDITSLDKHRHLSSMERELNHWKNKAYLLSQEILFRDQALHKCKTENISTQQQLEHVIRELLEKQKSLTSEVIYWKQEAQQLKQENNNNNNINNIIKKLQQELEASQERELETAGELSVVIEKLGRADIYIKTLSDEAVTYQLEIEQLRNQLEEKIKVKADEEEEEEEEEEVDLINNINNNNIKEEYKEKDEEIIMKKRNNININIMGELWSQLTSVVLNCADTCDEMSRECDELIDVIKEEQEENNNNNNNNNIKEKEKHFSFISCKPTRDELERLLHITLQEQQNINSNINKEENNIIMNNNNNNINKWEAIAKVIMQLLQGIQITLHSSIDDIIISHRAYAELSRVCRNNEMKLNHLQNIIKQEQTTNAQLIENINEIKILKEKEETRANNLQFTLNEAESIIQEAAALAHERTTRMENILKNNLHLEETIHKQSQVIREKDEINIKIESKIKELQEELKREQIKQQTQQHELTQMQHKTKLAQEIKEKTLLQVRELQDEVKMLQEDAKQCNVDRIYLRKRVEELEIQIKQMQHDRQLLREAKETIEWEKRQLMVQIDKLKRESINNNNNNNESVLLTSAKKGNLNCETIPSPPPKTQSVTESVNKLQFWENKLQAISSGIILTTTTTRTRTREKLNSPLLFHTPPSYHSEIIKEELEKGNRKSASLASLAYGSPVMGNSEEN